MPNNNDYAMSPQQQPMSPETARRYYEERADEAHEDRRNMAGLERHMGMFNIAPPAQPDFEANNIAVQPPVQAPQV